MANPQLFENETALLTYGHTSLPSGDFYPAGTRVRVSEVETRDWDGGCSRYHLEVVDRHPEPKDVPLFSLDHSAVGGDPDTIKYVWAYDLEHYPPREERTDYSKDFGYGKRL